MADIRQMIVSFDRVTHGNRLETGAVVGNEATQAEIYAALVRSPEKIKINVQAISEVQLKALLSYLQLMNLGADTSAVETVINAQY